MKDPFSLSPEEARAAVAATRLYGERIMPREMALLREHSPGEVAAMIVEEFGEAAVDVARHVFDARVRTPAGAVAAFRRQYMEAR